MLNRLTLALIPLLLSSSAVALEDKYNKDSIPNLMPEP